MARPPRSRKSQQPSHPPLWLVEGIDIVQRKRWLLASVALAVIVLGAVASLLLPQMIPATAGVGAAIGVAALLLGLAAAVASDATELVIRGPRHVAAAGGELVAVLPRTPSVVAAGPLAAAIQEVREPGTPLLLGFATAGRDARRTVAWTEAIARSLVASDLGVLRVDLASGRSDDPGLVEVVHDGKRLAEVVEYEPGVKFARLHAGRDHEVALASLTELPSRLPRDLDILLVSLPGAANRSVVAAVGALDHVLVVADRDRTSRVDLIAGLDALESSGTAAQVVLLDTSTALRLAPPVEVEEAQAEPAKRSIASTVGTPPVVVPSEKEAVVVERGDEDVVAQPEPASESSLEPESESESEPESEPEPESELDPNPQPRPNLTPEPEPELDPNPQPRPNSTPEPEPQPEPDSESHSDTGRFGTEGADAGSPRRAVEVLDAAAAATALSIAQAEQRPLDERVALEMPTADQPKGSSDELPQPEMPTSIEHTVDLTDAATRDDDSGSDQGPIGHAWQRPHDRGVAAQGDEDRHVPHDAADGGGEPQDNDTDRLQPIGVPDRAATRVGDEAEDELLRTTARLALIAQDLDLRDAGPAPEPEVSAPEPGVSAQEPEVSAQESEVSAPEPDALASDPDALASDPDVRASDPDVRASDPDVRASDPDSATSVAHDPADSSSTSEQDTVEGADERH